jgi:hypothetical protein
MAFSKRTVVGSVFALAVLVLAATMAHTLLAPRTRDGIYLTRSTEARVQQAYRLAREKQTLIRQLPCHCGCSKRPQAAHQNVLDCFKTAHAESCPICINTVLYANRALAEGRTVDDIRRYLRNVFAFDSFSTGTQ